MFGILWSSFLYLSHQCCYADSFFLSIHLLRSRNKLRSRCCRTHLRLELFHSVTLFLCTCFLELELLIFFGPFDVHWIWFVCLLHLSHHVIYFLLTTKSVLLKKTQSFSSSADLLISSLLILCKFHNQLYHTRDPEPSIEFHLLFILIAILFILDIIFYSLNYYTVSDINIELFYYTSPKSMSDCKDLKIQYKKDSVWDVKHIEQYQDNWWINK